MRRRLTALLFACLTFAAGHAANAQTQVPVSAYRYLPCRSSQLAAIPWTHRAYGHDIPGAALRNISLRTCSIWGVPKVAVLDDDGHDVGVRLTRKLLFDSTAEIAYAIAPSQAVFFAFYGQAGNGPFDRSCALYNQLTITPATDDRAIPLTMNAGTCGRRFTISQVFPVAELSATVYDY